MNIWLHFWYRCTIDFNSLWTCKSSLLFIVQCHKSGDNWINCKNYQPQNYLIHLWKSMKCLLCTLLNVQRELKSTVRSRSGYPRCLLEMWQFRILIVKSKSIKTSWDSDTVSLSCPRVYRSSLWLPCPLVTMAMCVMSQHLYISKYKMCKTASCLWCCLLTLSQLSTCPDSFQATHTIGECLGQTSKVLGSTSRWF